MLKRINPVLLLVLFSILVFVVRKYFFPDYSDAALVGAIEGLMGVLGPFGVVALLAVYVVCSFFFIPILIPVNMACGAIFGPVTGALVALLGIGLSTLASTISVRYVFRGMGAMVMRHQDAKRMLNQLTKHGVVMVIIIRLAFIVPYLLQNLILAMSNIKLPRLFGLTLVGALPGVVSYSFLGAGLVQLGETNLYGLYMMVPVLVFLGVTSLIQALNRRLGVDDLDAESDAGQDSA